MFKELMPLLAQRILILTLSRASDETICLNVIPKLLKSEPRESENALTTPLAVTGTPRELDEQLPKQLAEFVETHVGLSSTLNNAKEQMDAAAKAAREAARKSIAKAHNGSSRNANPSSPQVQTETGTTRSSDDSQSSPEPIQAPAAAAGTIEIGASTGSLFDVDLKADV